MSETIPLIRSFNSTKTLLILIQSLKANLTFKSIASLLNEHKLLTLSGKTWTGELVKGVLSRLRRHSTSPTSLYKDLVRLINAKIVDPDDAARLLMPQPRGRKAAY